MENFDTFVERLRDYVERRISANLAKNNEIATVENTTLNGYRALGRQQFLRYSNDEDIADYTIGSYNVPMVSE